VIGKNSLKSIDRLKLALHISLLYMQGFLREKLRWRNVRRLGYAKPRLFYSHERIPRRNEPSGGALIKLQDLDDWFPNTAVGANILYMVNSAMPIHAKVMVREAKKRGAIFVLNQNGVAYAGWHGPGWEKLNEPMRFLIKEADYVFYQSEFCKLGADKYLGPCRAPWKIMYNPVDTRMFVPARVKPQGLRILLAGSHQNFYRVQKAIEMMPLLLSRIPTARLTIAGRYTWNKSKDDCMIEARQLAQSMGVGYNVQLSGAYSQADAVSLFQAHHILLHTQYNDSCPRLIAEALSCGLPVVYSASGGVPELVGNEAGIGVPSPLDWEKIHSPNPKALAESVFDVFSRLDTYSASARKRAVQRLDVRDWLKEHESVFVELLAKHQQDVKL
jgi:glycosyltransferase involved in cell wall biosynthesis